MKHRKRDWENLWCGEINDITDTLSVSDIDAVRETSTEDFDHVVTVCQDSVEDNVGCEYSHFEMADGPQAVGKYGGSHKYSLFEEAVDTVIASIRNNERTLVQCHHGQSRSVAVCIAALAVSETLSYSTARNRVRDARPIANPDRLLVRHAKQYIHEHGDK